MTDIEHAILGIEAQRWRYAGAKDNAIVDLGLTPTRYHQILGALIDRPDAEAAHPQLVHRLRRIRDMRRLQRTTQCR